MREGMFFIHSIAIGSQEYRDCMDYVLRNMTEFITYHRKFVLLGGWDSEGNHIAEIMRADLIAAGMPDKLILIPHTEANAPQHHWQEVIKANQLMLQNGARYSFVFLTGMRSRDLVWNMYKALSIYKAGIGVRPIAVDSMPTSVFGKVSYRIARFITNRPLSRRTVRRFDRLASYGM